MNKNPTLSIIGLGYVGLPLAVCFANKYKVIGFDINQARVEELNQGRDHTGEVESSELKNVNLTFTSSHQQISKATIIIVTVPTPIDSAKRPDLTPVVRASQTVGKQLQKGSIVVYESTVFPGVTEDICVPILEKESGLKWKKDFNVGYSPERINPGDKLHTVDKILKVVAGDTPETAQTLTKIYGAVVTAGVYTAQSIKVAEAAKVIENTQRDLNIALMNELSVIFNKMDIDTRAVLQAAGTKWNFLPFEPGLVGGHCIGVDPYYLTFKAQQLGYHPEVILSGRRINDNMGKFIVENMIKLMIDEGKTIKDAKILLLGFTFKENVPDIRNTKVIDIVKELAEYNVDMDVVDPLASSLEAKDEYDVTLRNKVPKECRYDAVILAVKHEEFLKNLNISTLKKWGGKQAPILIDIKGVFPPEDLDKEKIKYWRL